MANDHEKKIDLVIIPTASTFDSNQRWLELLKTRAFLNSTNILRVNRIGNLKQENEWKFYGDSFFIDAFGEVQEQLGDQEEMLVVEVSKANEARNLWGFEKIIKDKEIN